MSNIKISTPKEEGVLQVSKSLKYQVLLDDSEMKSLLELLGPIFLGVVSEPVTLKTALIEKEEFLEKYRQYILFLKKGEVPEESTFRKYFSLAISADLNAFYAMDVKQDRFLLKTIMPVIQMQVHHFLYSIVDEKFHPLVLGKESVSWGIQFSYPQIAQNPKTGSIQKVSSDNANTFLFTKLSQFMREYTRPTPFMIKEKNMNEPIRIGKECFAWIANHPQLTAKGIKIRGANEPIVPKNSSGINLWKLKSSP